VLFPELQELLAKLKKMVEGQTSLSLRRLKETTNTTFKDSFNKIASFIVQKKKTEKQKSDLICENRKRDNNPLSCNCQQS
jgi:CRISPR/Cas system-associated protein Cas5 (RAMP superfamily)